MAIMTSLPLFLLLVLLPALTAHNIYPFTSCLSRDLTVFIDSAPSFNQILLHSFKNDEAIPKAIALASTPGQVSRLIRCAKRAGLSVCARSGGHSLAGKSLCEDLVIDVGPMDEVSIYSNNDAYVEPGANMGQLLWRLWHRGRRWVAAGVCPSVGVGGYFLGGGHGPYEGSLGVACDNFVWVKIVDRHGNILKVSRKNRKNLFWAVCGAGGSQFGVVVAFRMRTASSVPYDNAVLFRFRWPVSTAGKLMEAWTRYDEEGGDVWFRMEMYLERSGETGMYGYGACYRVNSIVACMDRLKRAPFFNTPGRSTVTIFQASSALDVHAFFGPVGNWARRPAPDLAKAFLQQRYSMHGQGNTRIHQSTFLHVNNTFRPSVAFWDRYIAFCANPGRESIPWLVCELNLFNNAIDTPRDNAFAFRDAHIITHYIIGGGLEEDKQYLYRWMKNHFSKFAIGVYINYPELQLTDYAQQYWGKSLPRLQRIKKIYDPNGFFSNTQPIPLP